MRLALALALLVLPALAGCTSAPPPANGGKGPPSAPFTAAAPWWDVGDAYTVRIERPGAPATTWRMVNFLNDTATAHFWLGVQDRRQAMDMALFDTNPLLGRIHHGILTPHERGMHAAMYQFPLEDGKRWNGFFFDGNWSFTVEEATLQTPVGSDRGFRIAGVSTDAGGGRVAFDYSPRIRWFTELETFDAAGASLVRAEVTGYERGATGTYLFLRGVDFYKGPGGLAGTRDERFTVDDDVDGLAFFVDARASGPLEVQLLDPAGQVRERVTAATGGRASFFDEVRPAPQGEWRVRYVTTGSVEGRVLATGLQETSATLT